MRFLESKYPKIEHSFNAVHRERFAGSLPDGYDRGSQKIFYLHGCLIHGMFTEDADGNPRPCRLLPATATPADKNIYNETYLSLHNRFEDQKRRIFKICNDKVREIVVMYKCQFFDQMKTPGTDIYNFFQAKKLSIKSKKPNRYPRPRSETRWLLQPLLLCQSREDHHCLWSSLSCRT